MGMILGLVTLSDANIRRVIEDPPLVWQVAAPDEPEMYEDARSEQDAPTLLSKVFGSGKRSERVPDLELSSVEGISTDLDKAWHGIHYLLTGTAGEGQHPHNFLLNGGTQVGEIEVGYGPARALTAAETREAKAALDAISDQYLKGRFDPNDMLAKDIYPEIWGRKPEEDDTLGYLMEYVRILRGFLNQAVDKEVGIIIYLS